MKKYLLVIAVLSSSIQLMAQCLMYPVSLSQRVSNSNLIIEGKVINQICFWNSEHNKIYTSNMIDVYKTFKNSTASFIEIITEGGTIGNEKHVFEPTLELNIGELGVFTLNNSLQPSQYGKPVFEAYASAQGFIKYDVESDKASEPFYGYSTISSTLYNTINQLTGAGYTLVKSTNPFQQTTITGNTSQAISSISGFSPTTITAGTFSVLTINGSGFGTTANASLIAFKNADDGGATTISPVATEIVSWTTTQIKVKVPSEAGTGVIKVNGSTSAGVLTIPYSHLNVTNSGNVFNTKHISQTNGGYTWTYNTAFFAATTAKAAFQRSLQSWRCNTFINWPIASTTSSITASASDGVNIVTFNSGLGAGILGQCGSYFSGCGSGVSMQWFVNELDIQFANTPGGLTWQIGPAAPTGSQYDFESVTVHELGHGHQLGHVINSSDLMHYAIANGQNKRAILTDDLNGGLAVMSRNAIAGGTCGNPLMTPLTTANCVIGAPTASFTANRTTICVGQTVAFTNLSAGSPTANAWVFQGGTPATSAVANPTITYNTSGTYSVQLTATNINGSSTYSVLGYINVVSAATLPLVQNFQSATFPPANWYVTDAGNDNVKWSLATNAGYNTTQSTLFDNFTTNVTGTRDQLKTYVNLTGFISAKMTFYEAFGLTFASPNVDSLEILVSTNCGTSNTQAYYKGGTQIATGNGNGTTIFIPTTAQWMKDSIDLTPYIGNASVMIAFVNRSHFGDGLYLDNINITGIAATSPTAAITSVNTGCTGTSVTLTDASTGSPTSWAWVMPGGTPSSASAQNTSVTYATAGVKTITLTVANASGTTTAVKSITITATPTVTVAITNTTVCSGTNFVQSLTGASSYTWLPSGSGNTSTLTPAATTIYTVTGGSGSCIGTSKTFTINVTSTPTVIVSPASATICAGQTTTLTASGATNYTWMPGSINTAATSFSPTSSKVYTVTGANGLCSRTKTVSVNVTSTPTVNVSVTNTTVCSGVSVVQSLTGATSYTWLPSGSGTTSTLTPVSTTIYTVTGGLGSCVSAQKNFTINVTTTPTVAVSPTSATICAGFSTTLTASGAASYVWMPGSQTTSAITVNPSSASVYTVTGSNGSCSSATTVAVSISAPPSIVASISNTTICGGTSLLVNVSGATSYTWLPTGSGSSSSLSPSSITMYTVNGSFGACNGTPATFTINVLPTPVVNASAIPAVICLGSFSNLSAVGAANFTWTPASNLSNANSANVSASPVATTVYSVSGTNGTACAGTNTILVTVNACTGIENFGDNTNFIIYPNPSNGFISINSSGNSGKLNVEVINTLGQTIKTENSKDPNNLTVDLSELSKGIYYLKIQLEDSSRIEKIILN